MMKNKIGYVGQKKPKDYTEEKYLVLPDVIKFSEYLKQIGILAPILLESQISLDTHDIDFLPFRVNIFDREKFEGFIINQVKVTFKGRALRDFKEMEYIYDNTTRDNS